MAASNHMAVARLRFTVPDVPRSRVSPLLQCRLNMEPGFRGMAQRLHQTLLTCTRALAS